MHQCHMEGRPYVPDLDFFEDRKVTLLLSRLKLIRLNMQDQIGVSKMVLHFLLSCRISLREPTRSFRMTTNFSSS